MNGHRRLRHGFGLAPPLPAPVPEALARRILGALELLRDAATRLDERLHAREPAPAEESAHLEQELRELLREIGAAERLVSRGPDECVAPVREHGLRELQRLRREQARVVFRLEELKTGVPSDERFLV